MPKASELAAAEPKNNFTGKYHGNGIYTFKAHLVFAEDCSNNPAKPRPETFTFNSGYEPEQCLKLNLRLEGKEELTTMYLMNKYNWGKDGQTFNGWRFNNNPIYHLLNTFLGDFEIPTTWEIDPELLNALVEIPIVVLSYCAGERSDKPGEPNFQKYSYFIQDIENNDEVLVQQFLDNCKWLKDTGKYQPEWYENYKEMKKASNDHPSATTEEPADLPF